MRVCVVGAGPSGLFVSKYLSEKGIPVTIYEKDSRPIGNYNYAIQKEINLEKILDDKNITLKLNTDHKGIDKSSCDFYVIATGGIPRTLNNVKNANLFRLAVEIIKNKENIKLGDKVCIVGLGNVTLDLLWHIAGKCKEVVVLSSKNVNSPAFDLYVFSKLIKEGKWNFFANEFPSETNTRRQHRFGDFFKKFVKKDSSSSKTHPSVTLLFNKKLVEAKGTNDGKVEVFFRDKDSLKSLVCDTTIASVGFIPNRIKIDDEKPKFYLGWCNNPKGNVSDALFQAKECAESILKDITKKENDKKSVDTS